MQPERLGRYQILKELGRGGMGRVYLAHDPEIDRRLAIKTVQFFADIPAVEAREARQRFLREARSAGKLLHPGIVTLFDVGEHGDVPYLAMEYVEGTTLEAYTKPDSLLPVEKLIEMIAGVGEALDYAHRNGIIHRDIKPANLMRVGEVEVKIMDFGLAKPPETQLTQDGKLLGTPSYMSPEQICGRPIDGRTDLFSLGVVMFEMLTGHRPFPGDSISSVIYRIVNEEPRDASAVHGRVPAPLDGFLRRALAKEPGQRPASGNEFAGLLREAAVGLASQNLEPAATPAEPLAATRLPPAAVRPPRSSPLPWVLGVLALIAVGAGGAFLFRERLGFPRRSAPAEVWWETRVRTEPPGLPVRLDGQPLDEASAGLVRFKPGGPFGRLSASLACRTAEHQLDAADAGGEVVLVLDPVELTWRAEPGIAGAAIELNGARAGTAPLDLRLDLCRANRLSFTAPGYRELALDLPAGATPLEARTQLNAVTLQAVPKGRLALPESKLALVYHLDGERLASAPGEIELVEGRHELRATNEALWIDVRQSFQVRGGETVRPELALPSLATLSVQAFPANCKIHLRRPGGAWKFLDDAPARTQIAAGSYEIRVTLNATGETREQAVELSPGNNPPVRITFARSS
jgi:hypothetical protein